MQVNNARLKLFVLVDTDEDFKEVVDNYDVWMHDVERLTDEKQLDGYDFVEVWDCRSMSRIIQQRSIQTFIMPNKED